MPTVLDGRSREEWPVAPHVLHAGTCRSSGDAIRSRYRFPFGFSSKLGLCSASRGSWGVLRPLGPIAPLHCERLCSRHSKRMASRWPGLPHALHRGLGHCALLWPCSWQRSHTSSLHAALLHMRFVSTRAAYAESSVWALAHRMASCTACAAHAVWARASLLAMPRLRAQRTVSFCAPSLPARCDSDPQRAQTIGGEIWRRFDRFRFVSSRSGLARTSA
jgi:hypothetical protein